MGKRRLLWTYFIMFAILWCRGSVCCCRRSSGSRNEQTNKYVRVSTDFCQTFELHPIIISHTLCQFRSGPISAKVQQFIHSPLQFKIYIVIASVIVENFCNSNVSRKVITAKNGKGRITTWTVIYSYNIYIRSLCATFEC